ncbi:25175_t:CDS:2, partial [Dentiscutata erythropus]
EFPDLSENSTLHLKQIGLFGDGLFDKIISVSCIEGDAALVSNIEVFGSDIDVGELVFISNVEGGELVFISNGEDS